MIDFLSTMKYNYYATGLHMVTTTSFHIEFNTRPNIISKPLTHIIVIFSIFITFLFMYSHFLGMTTRAIHLFLYIKVCILPCPRYNNRSNISFFDTPLPLIECTRSGMDCTFVSFRIAECYELAATEPTTTNTKNEN